MVPDDLSHKRRSPLRASIVLGALIAVNAGVGHMLIGQIATTASAHASISQVKDDSVTAQKVGRITTTDSIESIPPADDKPIITTYVVVSGDTLSGIAEKFNISANTIRWANDIDTKTPLKVGQTLTILPVTGIEYKVKSGDTLSGIAMKFDANQAEITEFNSIENGKIKVGMMLIIPDAEPLPGVVKKVAPEKKTTTAPKITPPSTLTEKKEELSEEKSAPSVSPTTSLAHPIPHSILTQGLHGYNGVDFGAPIGTSVHAALGGVVIVSKPTGYNGGYGTYIVIEHANGTQTLYGHLSKTLVAVGETVTRDQEIGKSGNTGKSTGPHLHFEVRGGLNPWTKSTKGTHF